MGGVELAVAAAVGAFDLAISAAITIRCRRITLRNPSGSFASRHGALQHHLITKAKVDRADRLAGGRDLPEHAFEAGQSSIPVVGAEP